MLIFKHTKCVKNSHKKLALKFAVPIGNKTKIFKSCTFKQSKCSRIFAREHLLIKRYPNSL